mmetsp:Transcript_12600/g.34456  ORF Transcript_12600/g.34456 Transcript_12600/m.34456 type:complete len:89 (+) Transcript_12600:92-358(+)
MLLRGRGPFSIWAALKLKDLKLLHGRRQLRQAAVVEAGQGSWEHGESRADLARRRVDGPHSHSSQSKWNPEAGEGHKGACCMRRCSNE